MDGRAVLLGSSSFLLEENPNLRYPSDQLEAAETWRRKGATILFMAVDGKPAGFLAAADTLKSSARSAVADLKALGLRVVMLTGDAEATARAIAAEAGIAEVLAGVLPAGKAEAVARLKKDGRRVAMAGDGVNDAPALAGADVGIAMGTGSDVAIESASATLAGGEIAALPRAIRLSRATLRNIRQNLFFAFVYNVVGVPVAAGVLYPAFGLLLSPVLASAAMTFSSLSVVGNALGSGGPASRPDTGASWSRGSAGSKADVGVPDVHDHGSASRGSGRLVVGGVILFRACTRGGGGGSSRARRTSSRPPCEWTRRPSPTGR